MNLSNHLAQKWAHQFGIETQNGKVVSCAKFLERVIIDTLVERDKLEPPSQHTLTCPAVQSIADREPDLCGRCRTIVMNCLEVAGG